MSKQNGDMSEAQERQLHQANLGGPGDKPGPEVIRFLATQDAKAPTEELDGLVDKSSSTSNISKEDRRSREWTDQIKGETSKMSHPPVYGVKGALRAFVYDDVSEFKMPLTPDKQQETEVYLEKSDESNARSEEGWLTETGTSDTKESIVRDEKTSQQKGGIMGRLRD